MSPSIQVDNFQQYKKWTDKNCAEQPKLGINLNKWEQKTRDRVVQIDICIVCRTN